jgi:hypothetical protein
MLDPEHERKAAVEYAQSVPLQTPYVMQLYMDLRYDFWSAGMADWETAARKVMDAAVKPAVAGMCDLHTSVRILTRCYSGASGKPCSGGLSGSNQLGH